MPVDDLGKIVSFGPTTASKSLVGIEAAINGLAAAGGTVLVEPGRYTFDGTIDIKVDGVHLQGVCPGAVTFVFTAAVPGINIDNVDNVTVSNITLVGPGAAAAGAVGVRVAISTGSQIRQCKFSAWPEAVTATATSKCVFDHNVVEGLTAQLNAVGVHLATATGTQLNNEWQITHNVFTNSSVAAVKLAQATGTQLKYNLFKSCALGVQIGNTPSAATFTDVLVHGNRFDACLSGLLLTSTGTGATTFQRFALSANMFTMTNVTDMTVNQVTAVKFQHNHSRDAGRYVINSSGGLVASAELANMFHGYGRLVDLPGVFITGSTALLVSGNVGSESDPLFPDHDLDGAVGLFVNNIDFDILPAMGDITRSNNIPAP